MKQLPNAHVLDFAPSVYFAESVVQCDPDKAWRIMLNYQAWNPNFVGVQVAPISGTVSSEGELVLISKPTADPNEAPFPSFYCKTIKVMLGHRIVWYCYPKEGEESQDLADSFRNFVDFGLTPKLGGVRFNVGYYAQKRLSAEQLATEKNVMQAGLESVARAFRDYCERQTGAGSALPRETEA